MTQILTLSREASEPTAVPVPFIAEQAVARLLEGHVLERDESCTLFESIVEGRLPEPLMAAAFVALRMRGEAAEELIGAATALRSAARGFPAPDYLFADSCGTGGDFSGSINVSTAA